MNEEQDLKLTDLDYLTGDHHLQMMKAALPYMEVPEQRMLSVFVKINELQRTISLFRDEEVAAMGICSLDHKKSPLDMLQAIKPYAAAAEQDLIDLISGFVQGGRMSAANLFSGFGGNENASFSASQFFDRMTGMQTGEPDLKATEAEIPESEIPGSEIPESKIPGSKMRDFGISHTETPNGDSAGGASTSDAFSGGFAKRPMFEQIKGFLTPEQQSRVDMIQMMMQAMQQFS